MAKLTKMIKKKTEINKRKKFLTKAETQKHQRDFYNRAFQFSKTCPFGDGFVQELHWKKRINISHKYIRNGDYVLDLGCGDGTVTHTLLSKAAKAVGIDISEECIERAKSKGNHPRIEYIHMALEDYAPLQKFDAILMFEVIEHLYDPQFVLQKAHAMLKKGGIVILSTPNFSNLVRRIKKVINPLVLKLGFKGANELAPEHVCEYTYSEVCRFLQECGFKLIKKDGAILVFPFIEILKKLTSNKFIHRLNFYSGSLCPSLAIEMYIVAKKV